MRDGHVTGVQTCALPISISTRRLAMSRPRRLKSSISPPPSELRSEERRVGKACIYRGRLDAKGKRKEEAQTWMEDVTVRRMTELVRSRRKEDDGGRVL